jgi:hypothetical protein
VQVHVFRAGDIRPDIDEIQGPAHDRIQQRE